MFFPSVSRRHFLRAVAASSLAIPGRISVPARTDWGDAASRTLHFHRNGILGTSFDLVVRGNRADAANEAECVALAEIERLRQILSTYDPASEISRLNATGSAPSCSFELLEVLGAYSRWTARTRGAFSGQLGEAIRVWRAAESSGSPPSSSVLAKLVESISTRCYEVDASSGTVVRLVPAALNIDSLGKGYILGKAVAAVCRAVPSIRGLLLNLGGDLRTSGEWAPGIPWRIGIANPSQSADNAPPLTEVRLTDRAISTSAAYERGFTVAGRRYSHILDPRTGFPAEGVSSATVVAEDNTTANALATTLCVLTPEEGLALVEETPGADGLIVAANGQQFRSAGFAAIELPALGGAKKNNEAKPSLWPKDFRLTLVVTLKTPGGGGYKRPYVAVWAENERREHVRTIVLWGNQPRYFPDLHDWSYGEKDRLDWAATIARATRPPGRHRVVWDGRDDSGNPVPPGKYTIYVEANREHGTYAKQGTSILCGDEPAGAEIKAASEFDATPIQYGPPSAE